MSFNVKGVCCCLLYVCGFYCGVNIFSLFVKVKSFNKIFFMMFYFIVISIVYLFIFWGKI